MERSDNIVLKKQVEKVCHAMAWTIFALGLCALLGWQFNIEILTRPIPNTVAMNPATAVCFMLCALAILFKQYGRGKLSMVAALLALLLGTIKLGALLFSTETFVDTLLFSQKLEGEIEGVVRNRMAPNTAFGFMLASGAILINRSSGSLYARLSQYAEYMTIALFFVSLISLLGYVNQIREFYGVMSFIPMAAHTAFGFMLLSLTILCTHPKGRYMSVLIGPLEGSRSIRFMLPLALLGPVVLGALRISGQRLDFFSQELGVTMAIVAEFTVFSILIWKVGRAINRNELQKLEDAEKLQLLNADLEEQVKNRTVALERQTIVLEHKLKELTDYKYAMDQGAIIAITDEKGIIRHANSNFCSISGYTKDELLGQSHQMVNSGYHPKEFFQAMWRTIASGKVWHGLIRNKRKDGTFYWVDTTIVPFLDAAGKPFRYMAIRSDQTAEKEISEQMEESEKHFRALVENGADGVIILSAEGQISYASHSIHRMLGYLPEEVVNENIAHLLHPDDTEGVQITFAKVLASPGVPIKGYTSRVRHKNGSWRWLAATLTNLIHDPAVIGIVDNFHDVTEQKEAEDRVAASEKRFRHTLDNMMEGVQIIDSEFRYAYANDALLQHGRYKREELLGHTMMECYPGIEKTEVFKVIESCMKAEQGTNHHLENEFNYPDGSSAWFELSIQRVPEGVFMLSIDITDRKRAENEVRELNASLEKKVEKRTAQLEASNRELESFSYSVSHDLRAPLRAINGFSEMMLQQYDKQIDSNGKRLLGVIRTNALTMGRLIDDLLEFSRTGRKELRSTPVDMETVVKGLVTDLQADVDTVRYQIDQSPLPSAHCDPQLIRNVWSNLLSNAIKYSAKEEQPMIKIWGEQQGDELIYHVQDNGAGFNMEYASKLFGVFQRLHSATEFEGTGVGLAIVNRIIQKHGGRIWAEGEVDKGATFHFSLPHKPSTIQNNNHEKENS